ncbi:hypothetical protein TNCV_3040791 [Trichonephila clavipes]|nr:hypothetical protein TNCV_3040751 [Trichonephila clavipes]GFV70882.1 hypothetical protein TNCV_3040771 [Trichonephila clavipes]GFV70884.1 hypothetical protein TNCV_3040791 [Trichonephila clavipes]
MSQACNWLVMSSSSTALNTCRAEWLMHVKSVKFLSLVWCTKWEIRVPVEVLSSLFERGSKLGGPSPIAPGLLCCVCVFHAQDGHGSLMVKVRGSWLACHEFDPSTAEDSPCRGG